MRRPGIRLPAAGTPFAAPQVSCPAQRACAAGGAAGPPEIEPRAGGVPFAVAGGACRSSTAGGGQDAASRAERALSLHARGARGVCLGPAAAAQSGQRGRGALYDAAAARRQHSAFPAGGQRRRLARLGVWAHPVCCAAVFKKDGDQPAARLKDVMRLRCPRWRLNAAARPAALPPLERIRPGAGARPGCGPGPSRPGRKRPPGSSTPGRRY